MDEKEIRKRLAGRAAEYMMFRDDEENAETTAEVSSPSNVIVFPDFEKLKSEVEKMRTELSMLLLERDELQFVICKNIETEYMLKLGSIEYKAYEAQCAALRLKRKIELIQAKKNRQEKVIISAIEETLDNEFAEYQKQLDEQIDKMNSYIELPLIARIALIVFAITTAVVGIGAAAMLEVKAGYYECPHCKALFVPTMGEYVKGYHTLTKRRLSCHQCGKTGMCKHRIVR